MRERFPKTEYLMDEESGGRHARDAEGTIPCATVPNAPKAAGAQTGRRGTGRAANVPSRADLKSPVIHSAFGLGPLAWGPTPRRSGRR
jgi:hypothetical protein